jgi:phosphoribosylanthranilate isomerase
MNRVNVKICGIRTLEEANAAVAAGADALGFNFWPRSARYIEPSAAQEIINNVSPVVSRVGVFVNEDANRVMDLALQLGLHAVQLHGDESPEFCESLNSLKTIKALRVDQDFDLSVINNYRVNMILLDSNVDGIYGGTGQRFDWRIAIEAKRLSPIVLAGGLTLENVGDAIKQVQPDAIDVCSGVEAEPGRKDLEKIQTFMKIVAQTNKLMSGEHDTGARTSFI